MTNARRSGWSRGVGTVYLLLCVFTAGACGQRASIASPALESARLKDDDWAKQWAGTYYTGDGLGMNVTITVSPKQGVSYVWTGCLGVYDENHGNIGEVLPDGLKLKLVSDESLSQYHFMSSRLYFVAWGERRYLVPEAQMVSLVNSLNHGTAIGQIMSDMPERYQENAKEVRDAHPDPPGHPVLPEKYTRMLLRTPLVQRITSVTPKAVEAAPAGTLRRFTVTLTGGSNQSVSQGLNMRYRIGAAWANLIVWEVDTDSCTAELQLGAEEATETPKVGDAITTLSGVDPAVWKDTETGASTAPGMH